MKTVYLKKSALATEPYTLTQEIEQLEAQVGRVQRQVKYLSSETKTLPKQIERTLRTIEALALADVDRPTPSARAKNEAIERQVALEEALERYQKDLETQQGDLATLQQALDEKRHKLSQYVAIQVME